MKQQKLNRMGKICDIVKHRKAFRRVERRLLGHNTLRGYMHDLWKIPMTLLLGAKTSSKIHRKLSRHHDRAKSDTDYLEMVIDWECARYTKPDKPLNARETLNAYYPHLKKEIQPILEKLGL